MIRHLYSKLHFLYGSICLVTLSGSISDLQAQSTPPPPRTVAQSQAMRNGPSQESTGINMIFRQALWEQRDKYDAAITTCDQELPLIYDLFRAGGTSGGMDYLATASGVDQLIDAQKLASTWRELASEGVRRSKLIMGVLKSTQSQPPADAVKAIDGLTKLWVSMQGVSQEHLLELFKYRWVLLHYAKKRIDFGKYHIALLKDSVRKLDGYIDAGLEKGGKEGQDIIEKARWSYKSYVLALKERLVRNKNMDQRHMNLREPVKNCLSLTLPDAALFPGYAEVMSHWKNYAANTVSQIDAYLEELKKYDLGRDEVARSVTAGSRHFDGVSFMNCDAVFIEALRKVKSTNP